MTLLSNVCNMAIFATFQNCVIFYYYFFFVSILFINNSDVVLVFFVCVFV